MNPYLSIAAKPARGSGERERRARNRQRRAQTAQETAPEETESGGEDARACWLCGRNGCGDPLDRHHIFGGPYREKSERYGAVVNLCHFRCHESGSEAAHRNGNTMRRLQEYGQRKIMEEQGWTTEDFIREFGRSYV